MKAVQYDRFGGPEVLRYIDLPDLTLPPDWWVGGSWHW